MRVKVSQLRHLVAEVVAEATAKKSVPAPKPGAKASRELPTDVEFNYGPPATLRVFRKKGTTDQWDSFRLVDKSGLPLTSGKLSPVVKGNDKAAVTAAAQAVIDSDIEKMEAQAAEYQEGAEISFSQWERMGGHKTGNFMDLKKRGDTKLRKAAEKLKVADNLRLPWKKIEFVKPSAAWAQPEGPLPPPPPGESKADREHRHYLVTMLNRKARYSDEVDLPREK